MTNVLTGSTIVDAAALVAAGLAFATHLNASRHRARERTSELQAAHAALSDHYEIVSQIVDDPALPTEAICVLVDLGEMIESEEISHRFVQYVLHDHPLDRKKTKPMGWKEQFEGLRSSRPDLVDAYRRAMMTGIIGMFLRWPKNAPLFGAVVAKFAGSQRGDMWVADEVIRARHRGNGDNTPAAGALMPA